MECTKMDNVNIQEEYFCMTSLVSGVEDSFLTQYSLFVPQELT